MKFLTITKKELEHLFYSPIAYVFLTVFLFLSFWLYFSVLFLTAQANLRPFFAQIPFLFVIFLPSVTMGQWADEKRAQTFEVLMTFPVRGWEIIVGKFLSGFLFLSLALLLTTPLAITVHLLGGIDFGPVIGGYLGLMFAGSACIAIGLFVSSLTENQIISFIVSVVLLFSLYVLGEPLVLNIVPEFMKSSLVFLSLANHINSISRGVIDLRDLVYYLSVTGFFLFLNTLTLQTRNWANRIKSGVQSVLISLLVLVAIGLVNVIAGHFVIRFDLTANGDYTLSTSTRKILGELDDTVTIKLFLSNNLPPRLAYLEQGITDVLQEYEIASKGKIVVEHIIPEESTENENEAQILGIPANQINVPGAAKLEVIKSYLGLALIYSDKKQVMPVIQNVAQLEYDITSALKKLIHPELPKVGVLFPLTSDAAANFTLLSQVFQKEYEAVGVDFEEDWSKLNVAALVIPEPRHLDAKVIKKINDLFESGVGILLLAGRMDVAPDLTATVYDTGLEDWLTQHGIELSNNLVIDPQLNAVARFSTQGLQYNMQYPFFVKVADFNRTHPVTSRLDSVVFPWTNYITIKNVEGFRVEALANTSPASLDQNGEANIFPEAEVGFETSTEEMRTIAVSLTSGEKNKMVVVASSHFAKDNFLNDYPANLDFLLNSVDWMTIGSELIDIRSRGKSDNPISISDPALIPLIKLVHMGFIPLGVILWGFLLSYLRRKRWKKRRGPFDPAHNKHVQASGCP